MFGLSHTESRPLGPERDVLQRSRAARPPQCATTQETWQRTRSELEGLLKEQPENVQLISNLALTKMGLGDKAAALALCERAMATVPIEKDAVFGPVPIEILARVAAQTGEAESAIAALQRSVSIPY